MRTLESVKQEARAAAWMMGATILGGAGAIATENNPSLREIAPSAVNYFEHSGNMLWSGFLGAAALIAVNKVEATKSKLFSYKQLVAAAALSGALVGGAANATYEVEWLRENVGQHLLAGGKTADGYDLLWGTTSTVLTAAGMAAHLARRRSQEEQDD